jgi:class 3 adenylate cyclase/2-polyprenyl-3-methyl-5-hydroxy-6-metoxy-1,4-benzoquinol methylase
VARTGTITVLFTDIVGSTEFLARLGEREWDVVRRDHFEVLREALAEFDGTEVKNTGDGIMAVFGSAISAVDCAAAMQARSMRVVVGGSPIELRIGVAAGEATEEDGDWFGTPVVEAARLCALADPATSYATGLVHALAGTQAAVDFEPLGRRALKGFEHPIDVYQFEAQLEWNRSLYASVDEHAERREGLLRQLDYWEAQPGLQHMRTVMLDRASIGEGDTVCDIGCGTGGELRRLARRVGAKGRVIGLDPSRTMLDAAQERLEGSGVQVEFLERDGRDTGLPDDCCDAVRIERVVQHIGDASGLVAEARRITRPGGRVVVSDTDWGSLVLYPGAPELLRRMKTALEQGPMADPWAGRKLHGALADAGFTDVTTDLFAINAGPGMTWTMHPVFDRFVELRVVTRAEVDEFSEGLDAAIERGEPAAVFIMFVATGTVPA